MHRGGLLLLLLLSTPLALADAAADFAAAQEQAAAGDLRAAQAAYEQLVKAHPDNADYLVELGRTQLALKRALAAMWTLRDAVKADPDREQAYRLLMQAYFESGQSEQAYGVIQEARARFGEQPWMDQ